MFVRNITLNNFQCYYGTHSLDFDKGLNIVIGNGGKGKSKLFNAFYWVLFGKIYITDFGWCSTNGLPFSSKGTMQKYEFINKKALFETETGSQVTTSVLLEMLDDNGNIIQIERSMLAVRLEYDNWDSDKAWSVDDTTLKVTYDTTMGTKPVYGVVAEDKINELFPEGIRNYIWFQGESLDSLINFRDKNTLKAAVKHISYYPYYEKLSEIIRLAKDKITTMESKRLREVNNNNDKVKNLLATIENARKKIETEEANKTKLENDIDTIKVAIAEGETKMSGMASFTGLLNEYNKCELEITKLNDELNNLDTYQREQLPNFWVLRGIQKMLEESKEYISKHTEEELTLPEKKYIDEPSRSKLEEILRTGQCFVCGSPVQKGNHAHQWILDRIKAQEDFYREMEDYKSNMQFTKEFSMFIGKIQDYPDELLLSIDKIDKNFLKNEDDIEKLKARRNKILERRRELDKKIEDMKLKYGVDIKKSGGEVETINSTIRCSRSSLERTQRSLDACKNLIAKYKADLREAEKEYNKLEVKDHTINKVAETEWKTISSFLQKVCSNVQEKARRELLIKIQDRANMYYQRFTEHDNGYRGNVTINDDYSIDFDPGLNTSHEDRKKISIINAMLSLNQDAVGVFYPFISDAPTSNFDPLSSIYYMMGIKDIFQQSIIMTKDLVPESEEYNQLVNSSNVGRIYELQSQLYRDTEDPGLNEVSTVINFLK